MTEAIKGHRLLSEGDGVPGGQHVFKGLKSPRYQEDGRELASQIALQEIRRTGDLESFDESIFNIGRYVELKNRAERGRLTEIESKFLRDLELMFSYTFANVDDILKAWQDKEASDKRLAKLNIFPSD